MPHTTEITMFFVFVFVQYIVRLGLYDTFNKISVISALYEVYLHKGIAKIYFFYLELLSDLVCYNKTVTSGWLK